MKKLLFVSGLIVGINLVLAQAPQSFNYQAVIRDGGGFLFKSEEVSLRITILKDDPEGDVEYSETFLTTTNDFGIVNLNIGTGNVETGVFSTIDWGGYTHYIKVEVDLEAGTNYTLMGTTQLLSVPYALFSEQTGDTTRWRKNASGLYYAKGRVGIGLEDTDTASLLHVDGYIRADSAFKHTMFTGYSDTLNQVTNIDFTNNKLKYKTCIYSGGIIVYTSEESEWVENADEFILPPPLFICGTPIIDERDGKVYPTVAIGDQCWLAKNLDVGMMISSSTSGYNQTDNGEIEKYCYDNAPANCETYGGLYEWPEAMQYVTTDGAQGICPDGWHIPTDEELKLLEGSADSFYPVGNPFWSISGWRGLDVGCRLRESGTDHWQAPNACATNESGFTALGSGFRNAINGGFLNLTFSNPIWSSTNYSSAAAWCRVIAYDQPGTYRGWDNKQYGYSVRCLKDN